ncbi:MAG TPA: prepilin-type N-terminal cleavage/methylation domain-containing protein [Candidatus Methylacidiphilales bacterium]
MKSRPTSRSERKGEGRGFTLVEVLVAVTVMVLLVGMMAAILGEMGKGWTSARSRVNNFTKARAMLDLMTFDLQGLLSRPDLPPFTAESFYTQRPAPGPGTSRSVSAIGYKLTDTTLQRASRQVDWANTGGVLAFGQASVPLPAADYDDVASGVIDFKVLYLRSDGTLSGVYTADTRAIGVTLAVVDDQTMVALGQAGGAATRLHAELEESASLTRSVKADWEGRLRSMRWDGYPKPLGGALKIFERYVSLPASS